MVNHWAAKYFKLIKQYFIFLLIILNSTCSLSANAFPSNELQSDKASNTDMPSAIKVALPSHPFQQKEKNEQFNNLIDFLNEYWNIWGVENNISVELIYLPPLDLTNALHDGRADVIGVTLYNAEQKNILFSLPYAQYKQYIFRRLGNSHVSPIKIGIHQLQKKHLNFVPPHYKPFYYNKLNTLITNNKKYDALYSYQPKLLSRKLLEKDLLKNYYVSNNEVPPLYLRFATLKNNRKLIYLINDSIRNINAVQVNTWKEKYPPAHGNLLKITLGEYIKDLSEAEKQFVIDNIEIKYPVTATTLPPYIIDSNKTNTAERGMAIDLFNIMQEKIGPIFVPCYIENHQQAINAINDKKIDILILMKKTQQNSDQLNYTSPYEDSHYDIIKQNQLPHLKNELLENFLNKSQFSFATSKKNTTLTSLLNKSLATITPDQFDNIYAKWSSTSLSTHNAQEQIEGVYRKGTYILLIIFLLVFIVFAIYYRQIQKGVSSIKRIEDDLLKAEEGRKIAEKSAQEKITFLARMSHEIRTPMNGVFGMAENLSYTELNPHQQELLDTLQSSAGNLMALLNDVLDFSKMDAGKLTLESVPVNLHQLTRNVMNSLKSVTPEGLTLTSSIDDKITHNYLTDPTRLTQILNNLISNAMKFTEKGTVSLTYTIDKSDIGDKYQTDFIRISVKDTGIGIPAEHQPSLFTPFKQADDQITRKFGGTGLGLSICQEIVTAMNSSIHLESFEGEGSNFYFTLALKQSGVESDTDDRRKNKRAINPPNDNRFKSLKVLVAEDNLVNLKVLTAQLERLNIFADVAENGEEALILHHKNNYDIIISDCHMPKVDGFELASTVSKQEHTKPIWLIAITADALSGAAENCTKAGFNDYMSKPCPQEVITDKLNNAYRQLIKMRDN